MNPKNQRRLSGGFIKGAFKTAALATAALSVLFTLKAVAHSTFDERPADSFKPREDVLTSERAENEEGDLIKEKYYYVKDGDHYAYFSSIDDLIRSERAKSERGDDYYDRLNLNERRGGDVFRPTEDLFQSENAKREYDIRRRDNVLEKAGYDEAALCKNHSYCKQICESLYNLLYAEDCLFLPVHSVEELADIDKVLENPTKKRLEELSTEYFALYMDLNPGIKNKKIIGSVNGEYDFLYFTVDKDSGLLKGAGFITGFGTKNQTFSYGVPHGRVNINEGRHEF